ncbi:GntR family transcriptional regulator [Mesorhizobium sp. M7A.F.Ca.CA.001.09.2.1]|uniref:GntR family transcriptional regulator n=2 Tax=Mesorhizobium TaxID=68287 RepID=A0AB38TA78_9HYPH|nr:MULTISPECIES: GntR family transcriptional regulator [Mesorhizobium]RUY58526.1 GntR family transcriptional regulator [Mesorhizobium sp. M7A.F.Ca.CA.001.13.2.1]RVA43084.1 GntR family transcriptional regulator [Mesorhizobium sp. M7A.F.Ca.US.001.01.1.1]MDF3214107.1 GntR family transcriptional regulator [Mesorhizobium ciceri]RUY62663.1 GntR family transcriptional regulator [Mesorhizobium sp. M7A.F.Ca.CA.001.05.1.1]RUY66706.1 GntR family transcriptional regulator [Mesorhizobium sp. M7A.F.Ca.CA.00
MGTKLSGATRFLGSAARPKNAGQREPSRVLEPVNNRMPISPQIYERLRRAITTLAMLPSEALSEQDLAQQLGVSRTPVREALIRLADEGLIDILPQRGSFVAPIRLSDVEEAQFIREALEVSVVQKLAGHGSSAFIAAGRVNLAQQAKAVAEGDRELFLELDEGFHRSLCEEAGLPKSWRVIQVVKLQMDRVRYLSLPEPGHLETLLAQHVAIFEAVETGEAKQAGARMAAHLREVLRTVQRLNVARPDLFGQ